MSKEKGSGMVIKDTGGKDFPLDPTLDPKGDYEARIVGFIHIGVHEKDVYIDGKSTGKKEEQNQAIVLFEFTEEETFVERGPDDNKKKENRYIAKFLKYSSHEKSNLFGIASSVGPDAAFKEGNDGRVDPVEMVSGCVTLKLSLNGDKTKNNVKGTAAIPKKYQGDVPDAIHPLFCYSVDQGAFVGGIEDVPPWMLNFAYDNAMYPEAFEDLENLEKQIGLNKEAKDAAKAARDKLEGDDKPSTTSESEGEPTANKESDDKPSPSRRRRGRGKTEEAVDYSGKTIEEMEDILLEKGTTDDDLNSLADDNVEDSDYLKALIAVAQS